MHVLWRGDVLQRLRLISGLILFLFALTHFLNHALGLISIVPAVREIENGRDTEAESADGE